MWRVVLVGLAGCGRLAFDPQALDSQAGDVDATAPVDAPFGRPQKIAELATSVKDEDDPSLTDDMLEMYFDDSAQGLVRTTRSALDQSWSAPVAVMELNAGGNVNNAKVTGDSLAIYFASTRAPAMAADIWVATRSDRQSPFSAPQLVTSLQSVDNDIEPWVIAGGRVVYLTRQNVGFLRGERATTADAFVNFQVQSTLKSGVYDGSMWVSADDRVTYFHSDRVSSAERAIYRATRASASDLFGAPVRLTELDMPGKEEDPWLSPDGHVLYFSSDTDGQYDLYTATR